MFDKYRNQPIFIVGAPRSGTTLLAAILNAHPRISCGNETHFFERITSGIAAYLTEPHRWSDGAVRYMSSLDHMGNPLFKLYQVDMRDYAARVGNARPAVAAILTCFMEAYLANTGKTRWAEKTPGHLKQFKAIREHFPTSRVVCIFRDPRDVALSLLRVPWGTSRFMDGLLIWRSYYNYYKKHIEGDKWTLTIKYEDLVREPVRAVHSVSTFLGEDFDEGMLDTSRSAADVGAFLEEYKANSSAPVDATHAFAWKDKLGRAEVALCDRILHDALNNLDYSAPSILDALDLSLYPLDQYGSPLPNLHRTDQDVSSPKI